MNRDQLERALSMIGIAQTDISLQQPCEQAWLSIKTLTEIGTPTGSSEATGTIMSNSGAKATPAIGCSVAYPIPRSSPAPVGLFPSRPAVSCACD